MKLFQVKFMIIVLRFIYAKTRNNNEILASQAIELHNTLEIKLELGELG